MIDKRLQYVRQMYAMGQRVGFQGGGRDAGKDSDFGSEDFGGGYNEGRNMANIAGPKTTKGPDMSHYGDPDPEVGVPTAKRQDTITSFGDNYRAQVKSMGLKNAIPGAQIYNLSKTALQTAKAREMLGLGPAVGPGPTDDDGDGQGIMQVQPNMLNVAGPVVGDETIDIGDGDTEFVNRFEVSPEARQAQGVAALLEDQAIAEMISKLYT